MQWPQDQGREAAPLGARETGACARRSAAAAAAWRIGAAGHPGLLVVQLCSGWVGAGQAGAPLVHLVKSKIDLIGLN